MTLQMFSPTAKQGGDLTLHGLLARNRDDQNTKEKTLNNVKVDKASFSEGSQRASYIARDGSGNQYVMKRMKKDTQEAQTFVEIRNYAFQLAKVKDEYIIIIILSLLFLGIQGEDRRKPKLFGNTHSRWGKSYLGRLY